MASTKLKQVDIEELLANLPDDPSGIGLCTGCQQFKPRGIKPSHLFSQWNELVFRAEGKGGDFVDRPQGDPQNTTLPGAIKTI